MDPTKNAQGVQPLSLLPDAGICRRRGMGMDGAMAECLVANPAVCSHVIRYGYGYICDLPRTAWSAAVPRKKNG
jgi:hypothetical protein